MKGAALQMLMLVLAYWLAYPLAATGQEREFGQSIDREEKEFITEQLTEQYWGNSTSVYEQTTPEQFLSAPAVVLEQTVRREFYRNSRNFLRTINLEHKIIRLQDKDGVADHTVFGFEKVNSPFAFDVLMVKVVKPDGRERIVDLDSVTISRSESGVYVQRFAVPGLEVGDIVDYFYYLEFRVLFPQQYTRIFDPVYWLAQGEYPIVRCELEFLVGPSAFLNASSYNLPPFEKVNYKVDRKTFSRYGFTLENLEPVRLDLPYYFPFRELPHLRYQVFISPYSGNTDIVYNLGGSLKLNTDVQNSRLQDFMVFALRTGREYHPDLKEFLRYLKMRGVRPGRTSVPDLANRYFLWERDRGYLKGTSKRSQQEDTYRTVSRMHYMLQRLNVKHDIVLAFDRSHTDIDHFLLTDEVTPLIRVTAPDTMLLSPPGDEGTPGAFDPLLEAAEAYVFDPRTMALSRIDMPASAAADNRVESNFRVDIGDGAEALVRQEYRVTGHSKKAWQGEFVNTAADFLADSVDNGRDLSVLRSRRSKVPRELLETLEETAAARSIEIISAVEGLLLTDPMRAETIRWELKSNGLGSPSDTFSILLEYQTDDLLFRTADGRLMPIRSLIDPPGITGEDLRGREANLYFEYPSSRHYSILLNTAGQLEVVLPDNLEMNVENEAGSFSVQTEQLDQSLVITVDWIQEKRFVDKGLSVELEQLVAAFREFMDKRILIRNMN